MASDGRMLRTLLGVKKAIIVGCDSNIDNNGVQHAVFTLKMNKRDQHRCPICGKKCVMYDTRKYPRRWRALDSPTGVLIEYESQLVRIRCPVHKVHTERVPWAYPGSRFTKDFDLVATWLVKYIPRTAICEFLRIDWETVGRCVSRASRDLEPDITKRRDGLVNIGIDETSYKKGHKFITVVVNHDTNTVVWAHVGYGKQVLDKFFNELTQEQKSTIKVVTGDGARWITDSVQEHIGDCQRCVDPFHVVSWSNDSLNEVRLEARRSAEAELRDIKQKHILSNSQEEFDGKAAVDLARKRREAETRVLAVRQSKYPLGKCPKNLTENQKAILDTIAVYDTRLLRAYQLKEGLRTLLKIKDVPTAETELKRWLSKACRSKIKAFVKLSRKIRRHYDHIINTIRLGMSNARLEATNNKIKLIIRKAYGLRNIQSLIDMVYLVCSNLMVPLPNRGQCCPNTA